MDETQQINKTADGKALKTARGLIRVRASYKGQKGIERQQHELRAGQKLYVPFTQFLAFPRDQRE